MNKLERFHTTIHQPGGQAHLFMRWHAESGLAIGVNYLGDAEASLSGEQTTRLIDWLDSARQGLFDQQSSSHASCVVLLSHAHEATMVLISFIENEYFCTIFGEDDLRKGCGLCLHLSQNDISLFLKWLRQLPDIKKGISDRPLT